MKTKKEKPILEENDSSVDVVIRKQNQARNKYRVSHTKPKLFFLATLCSIVLLFCIFFRGTNSKVQNYAISGISYLSKAEILDYLNLDYNTRFIAINEKNMENSLKQLPIVKNCTITKEENGSIKIIVEEKKIVGYIYKLTLQLVLEDGSLLDVDESKMNVIARLPLIDGFDDDTDRAKMAASIAECNEGVFSRLAEIHQVDEEYESLSLELVTSDGIHIFCNVYGVSSLVSYNGILSLLNDNNSCLYIDEMSGNAWSDDCSSRNPIVEEIDEDTEISDDENAENSEN